ncbi:uncharacterized protein BO96DRAFT_430534 [Aspergillus niger CBS 101883]|uniref:uncharacterized protein n=1 Tax=Aspergillus lacticoffeatus (strain CBS 101883) TaxID=1450533 RepID=UPI000D7F32D2|nr:uncharacterized protein BO96DRAFT_430534 [Aspergillus niger CBS 101883]PYH60610.1 hypothetical protein BO96DRAFT_430534 [Aspergillus niger CBS 101883]
MQGQGVAEEKASIQYQTAAGSWLNVEQLAGIDFSVGKKVSLSKGSLLRIWPGDNTESSGAWPESSVPPGPLLEPRLRPPSCSSAVTANY